TLHPGRSRADRTLYVHVFPDLWTISVSDDGVVLWDLSGTDPLATVHPLPSVSQVSLASTAAPSPGVIVNGPQGLRSLSAGSMAVRHTYGGPTGLAVDRVAVSADGKVAAAADQRGVWTVDLT